MAGNTRFDSSAASPEELAFKGIFPNRQRGNLINGSLDRPASFRKGNDGQMFISGANMLQGNSISAGDADPLAQSLALDPITMGDQKYTRSGELRRVLGISFGATLEDCAFETANLKSPLPVATDELKRFKACIQEASARARYRSIRLDESLHKLNKCWEAVNSKKQLRNELLPNERMNGSHLSKMGSQTHQSPAELANQRLEDRPKNVILNKRIRTSAAEIQDKGQSNSFARQRLAIGKDRDNIKDSGTFCDVVEERNRRLPASGETWDRKVKRKRSMGTVFARSIDGERELERDIYQKPPNESGQQSSDAQGLRLNVRDKNYTGNIYTLTKDKPSRAPETDHLITGNSEEALEALEQPSNVKKPHSISGTVNRKRPLPAGSSISHMAQWVGQRPQKTSRTRRANVVSPVLDCDEVPVSLEGCSPSDVGTSMASTTTNGSLISKGAINSIQLGRMKHDNDSSPTRLSESEESGAGGNGENKLTEKRLERNEVDERAINNSYNISSSMSVKKKKKMLNKEETGDGMRRQGKGSRGSSVLKTGISSPKEKLEISTLTKPVQNMKPASEKNGSKSGRPPLKKSRNSKAITRLGHPTSNFPDIAGESDDDREELLAAANFASNASYIGCSSSFWKKMEPNFAPVNLEDIAYLKQLVKTIEVDHRCLSQMLCLGSDAPVSNEVFLKVLVEPDGLYQFPSMLQSFAAAVPASTPTSALVNSVNSSIVPTASFNSSTYGDVLSDNVLSQSSLERERERSILNQTDSREMYSMVDMVDQHHNGSFLCSQMDSGGNIAAPLYQRVLTALIIDDQTDEETVGDGNMSFLCERDDSPLVACFSQDVENRSSINNTEYGFNTDMVSCNGNATFTCGANIHVQELDSLLRVDQRPLHPKTRSLPMLSENGSGGLTGMSKISFSSSSRPFEQMSMEDKLLLELQSVGLYPESVPDLADGDCEAIDQDIIQLQKGLFQQLTKKREYFMKLIQAVDESREMEQRALEKVATEKLIELAYKKKLATRGRSAARYGLSKVSRPVALAFMKRTLARCRRFEETGKSCFLQPVLKNVLFATPARDNYADSAVVENLPLARNSQQESALSGSFPHREQNALGNPHHTSDLDFAKTGPIMNRGKKKEVLLDDVGATASASLRPASNLGNSFMGGAKGKRSERDRDKDTFGKNSVTKGSLSFAGNTRGERKTKARAKPKAAQLSTSLNGSLSKLVENTNSELSIETEEPLNFRNLHELDPIELGVANELNGHQDLDFWSNIDEDGLQDNDAVGLDIPMDDLSDLNMLL